MNLMTVTLPHGNGPRWSLTSLLGYVPRPFFSTFDFQHHADGVACYLYHSGFNGGKILPVAGSWQVLVTIYTVVPISGLQA